MRVRITARSFFRPTGGLLFCSLLAGAMLAPALPASAESAVLVYRDANKWVAPKDNAPLIKLRKEAREGATYFKVVLPAKDRALAVERLDVLQDLLAREASKSIVIEEKSGTAAAGTIRVEY